MKFEEPLVIVNDDATDAFHQRLEHGSTLRKAMIRFGIPKQPTNEALRRRSESCRASIPENNGTTKVTSAAEICDKRASSLGRGCASVPLEDLFLSKGSALHFRKGECKPCAWRWKSGGCSNSVNCLFCHLCDQGALKLRKHERRRVAKNMRQGETKNEAIATAVMASSAETYPAPVDGFFFAPPPGLAFCIEASHQPSRDSQRWTNYQTGLPTSSRHKPRGKRWAKPESKPQADPHVIRMVASELWLHPTFAPERHLLQEAIAI